MSHTAKFGVLWWAVERFPVCKRATCTLSLSSSSASLVLTRLSYISFVQRVWPRSIDKRWLPCRRVLCWSLKLLDLPRATLICHNQSLAFALANFFTTTVTELAAVAGKSNCYRIPWGGGPQHHRYVLVPWTTLPRCCTLVSWMCYFWSRWQRFRDVVPWSAGACFSKVLIWIKLIQIWISLIRFGICYSRSRNPFDFYAGFSKQCGLLWSGF